MEDDRIQLQRRRRRKRALARKRARRRRRISLLIFIIIIISIAAKINSCVKNKKDVYDPVLPKWYLSQVLKENRKEYETPDIGKLDPDKFPTIAYEQSTALIKRIKPGSNHIVNADRYAYSTAEIRSYIRGEAEYTKGQKLVFLTFDDGPNTTVTPMVLDVLKSYNVPATFFLQGSAITENTYPVLDRMMLEGHGLALHSYSHDYEVLYPDKTGNPLSIISEAKLSQERLREYFGKDFYSRVWRYPGGHMSWVGLEAADEGLKELGIEWIDWNSLAGDAESRDSRPTSVEEQIAYVDRSLNKNLHNEVAVVLMHDAKNKRLTVDALPGIIKYFEDKGYEFGILE